MKQKRSDELYLELVNRCRRTGLEPVAPAPHLTPTSPRRTTEPGRRKPPVAPVRTGGEAGRTGRESAVAARRCAAMSRASVGRPWSGETPAGGRRGKPSRSSGTPRWSGGAAVHLSGWKRTKLPILLLETQTQKSTGTGNTH